MSALDDAREAVQRSDLAQRDDLALAGATEVSELRAAMRALIQHQGELEQRVARIEGRARPLGRSA